jgi:glycosyltransferase involved in cell wall biosynthesis
MSDTCRQVSDVFDRIGVEQHGSDIQIIRKTQRMGRKMTVLNLALNGWELLSRPSGAESLHLLEWIREVEAYQARVQLHVFHPRDLPANLPPWVETHALDLSLSPRDKLAFEQCILPQSAARLGAELLLNWDYQAPLLSHLPVICRAARPHFSGKQTTFDRLRRSLGAGGASGARGVFSWSETNSIFSELKHAVPFSPFVGQNFRPLAGAKDVSIRGRYKLPLEYVLAWGGTVDVHALLQAAWTWVDEFAGELHPLVLMGLDDGAREEFQRGAEDLGIADTIHYLSAVDFDDLPAIFRGAAVYFDSAGASARHGKAGMGQALRWAMACGTPIAAIQSDVTEFLLGDAAYLCPAGDARTLGAVFLSLLVEEELAGTLRRKGLLRAQNFHYDRPLDEFIDWIKKLID